MGKKTKSFIEGLARAGFAYAKKKAKDANLKGKIETRIKKEAPKLKRRVAEGVARHVLAPKIDEFNQGVAKLEKITRGKAALRPLSAAKPG
jgi:hypothetical protein